MYFNKYLIMILFIHIIFLLQNILYNSNYNWNNRQYDLNIDYKSIKNVTINNKYTYI
jgi:hypothetical protein